MNRDDLLTLCWIFCICDFVLFNKGNKWSICFNESLIFDNKLFWSGNFKAKKLNWSSICKPSSIKDWIVFCATIKFLVKKIEKNFFFYLALNELVMYLILVI